MTIMPFMGRAPCLEEPELIPLRRLEQVAAERAFFDVQAVLSDRAVEAGLEQIGPWPGAAHAAEPVRIIILPPTHGLDDVHHLAGAVGKMLVEPGAEQGRNLERQAHRQEEAAERTSLGRRFDDMLELMIGNAG